MTPGEAVRDHPLVANGRHGCQRQPRAMPGSNDTNANGEGAAGMRPATAVVSAIAPRTHGFPGRLSKDGRHCMRLTVDRADVPAPMLRRMLTMIHALRGILSPKAGGVGLTLTAANHVVHLSRWWNPAVEDQATDRAYRIGQ